TEPSTHVTPPDVAADSMESGMPDCASAAVTAITKMRFSWDCAVISEGTQPNKKRRLVTCRAAFTQAWPLAARAQQPTVPVIGLLSSVTARQWAPFMAAFLQGLNEVGFVEGQNVATEQRWAEGQYDRLPAMAADLIQRRVAVIAALTTPAAVAAKGAT